LDFLQHNLLFGEGVEEDIADILEGDIEDIAGIVEVDIVDIAVEVVEDIPDMHDTVADIADMVVEEEIVGMDCLVGTAVDIGALLQLGMAGIAWGDIAVLGMSSNFGVGEVLGEALKHLKRQKCLECYSFADLSCSYYDLSAGYLDPPALESGLPSFPPFL